MYVTILGAFQPEIACALRVSATSAPLLNGCDMLNQACVCQTQSGEVPTCRSSRRQ